MKQNQYKNISAEDLLKDEYFISSMINPCHDSDLFWANLRKEKEIDEESFWMAVYLFDSLQVLPENISNQEVEDLWECIQVSNERELSNKKRKKLIYLAASILTSAAAVLFFLLTINISPEVVNNNTLLSIKEVKPPSDTGEEIQLVLSENEVIALDGKNADIKYDNNGKIDVESENAKLKKDIRNNTSSNYNQLIVPNGKRSKLLLQDGTTIWVNKGTRIVYPSVFDKHKREIYVDGEVYLDVEKDHQRPFIVHTKSLSMEVLGTSFTIKAYENDTEEYVVLVSGSLKVNSSVDNSESLLSPSQMLISRQGGEVAVRTVDVEDYILWKEGLYRYESTRLDEIMAKLSEYYGKDIKCTSAVAGMRCTGKLDLKDELESVLKGISSTAPIDYKNNNGSYLIIHKKNKAYGINAD